MSEFDFHITTPRLYLSYAQPTDAICDWTVEYGNGTIADRETARKRIVSGHEKLVKTGYGRYLISLRPSTESGDNESAVEKNDVPFSVRSSSLTHIGMVTMQLDRFPGAPSIPDLGFSLLDRFQNRGYASEAARALMKYFEEEKGVTEISGLTEPGNENAKKIFRRLGFEDRGLRDVEGVVEGKQPLRLSVWTFRASKTLEEYKLGKEI